MSAKGPLPRTSDPIPVAPEVLRAAYEAHTLAQMLYGRIALLPSGAVPMPNAFGGSPVPYYGTLPASPATPCIPTGACGCVIAGHGWYR